MNFLAHLFIADRTPESMVGSILPDLLRRTPGRPAPELSPAIAAAAEQHRRVDAFTDTHPIVARSKARIRERHGRFAGILMDVFYDHLLAADFAHFAGEPLRDFTSRVYAAFAAHASLLPPPMDDAVDTMIRHDWLNGYASIDGIAITLRRMSARFSQRLERTIELEHASEDLLTHRDALRADFHAFFPQLLASEASTASPAPRRTPAALQTSRP